LQPIAILILLNLGVLMSEKLKVAGVQINPKLMDKAGNLKTILRHTEAASARGAGLAVFPECALTGYCFDSLQEAIPFAEPIPGPSTQKKDRRPQYYEVIAERQI
jgi:predicted amidohydrolase